MGAGQIPVHGNSPAGDDVLAPDTAGTDNEAVATGAATTFTVEAGQSYIVSCTTEQTFLDGGTPTSTAGMIIPAAGMVGPLKARSNAFRLIATTTAGRASVSKVS